MDNITDTIKENWSVIKETIRREYNMSDISYQTWVKPLEFYTITDDVIHIIIPSDQAHALNYISSKYKSFFQVTITEMFDHPYDIKFILEKDAMVKETQDNDMSVSNPVYNINYENANLNPKYKFDTFVVGSNNKFAHSASLAVAESPGEAYNPLYLYGGPGLGKTHLMHSIGHFILEQNPDKKVLYVTSEEFTNEVIESIRSGNAASMTKLREKYRTVDVLMVDDVQFIIGKESTQEEFFHTFNALYDARKQIVLTSDRPPKEIKTLEDRLRSRFEQDLIADIQPPDLETRIAIIKRKAELDGVEISDEVCEYVASKIKANIRQLEGTVKKIKAKYYLDGEKPTINSVQGIISDILNNDAPPEVTVERIIDEVARTYGVSADEIRSQKNRSANISNARHIAIYVTRELTTLSMVAIGEEFGNRHYSTIIYTIQKVQKMMEKDRKVKEIIDDTIKNIRDR